ncbi:hypothetical protein [Streptosporangium amethystogenes]|uniref:hypothetical protein n=1 Tax=Streptosporangium amethystogenes TaxID=2002 RepID=UPI0012FB0E2B|nr:hypothetical protein [Streptosporangium amethystogenes]
MLAQLAAFRNEQLGRHPSDRALAEAVKVSPTTVGDWLRGDRFPQRLDQLLALVRAVRVRAERARLAEHVAAAELLDLDRWRLAYAAEARRRAGGTRAAVLAEQGRAALEWLSPGRPLKQVSDPFQLEVHHAIDADSGVDSGSAGLPELPVYVRRDHDQALGAVVAQARAGESRVAVLVGGSSTGKTRACWEALHLLRNQPEEWRLWHPIDPTRADAVLADLERIGPRTVVWLNEAQFYLADPALGERVAAGVRELLRDTERGPVLVLATLWPTHWDALTTRPSAGMVGSDPHAQARELLARHKIKIPDAFTGPDLAALAVQAARDPRLTEAAERARDGQITQYLAGVPVLLDRYAEAPLATRALIHAAVDARRLGCGPRLPLALLAEAAPGYLTEAQWEQTSDDWLQRTLQYVTTPFTGIPGILTPIKTGAPRNRRGSASETQARATSGPLYRLADYLDQHGRRHRAEEIPPIDFWTAVAAHAHPSDLTALANTARARGLYQDAAQLYKNATTYGDSRAAPALVDHLHALHPTDHRPAHWAANHTALDNPFAVGWLLDKLREIEARDQIAVLLARDPATQAPVDNPRAVSMLLDKLWKVGAHDQLTVLAGRVANHISFDNLRMVSMLLDKLWKVGAYDQVTALLARDPAAHTPLENSQEVGRLLAKLREVGAHDQAAALAERAIAHVPLDDPQEVGWLLAKLWEVGAHDQIAVLLARNPASHAPLGDPQEVGWLLAKLREVGAHDQIAVLLARDPASHASLDDPRAVGWLLDDLRENGAHDQAAALAERAIAHAPLDDPQEVGWLLDKLQKVEAHDQIALLLARDPASHAPLEEPRAVSMLLDKLREVEAHDQIALLLARDPASHAPLEEPRTVSMLLDKLRKVGAHDQVTVLAERVATHAPLDNSRTVGVLLDGLLSVGAHDQIAILAKRAAPRIFLDDPSTVSMLLARLRKVGAHDQIAVLAERLVATGHFTQFIAVVNQHERFRFGCEPDTTAAAPWTWDDLE